MIYKALAFTAILTTTIFPSQAENISKHITTIVQPEPIKRVHPRYPIRAAKNGREGWAKVSFVIEKDGSVSNVLVNETSGSAEFANASKRAVSKWKYKPAFENGKPVQQCVNSVQMDFRMNRDGGEKGVSYKFLSKYKKAQASLEKKEFDNVELLLEQMTALKQRHLSENNYLHYLGANYQKALGNKQEEQFHLKQIQMRTLPDNLKLSVLNRKFLSELSRSQFSDAHSTYLELTKLSIAKPYMKNYKELIDEMDDIIGSNENIIISANIKGKDYWSYKLVRNEFSFVNIDGELDTLDIRCANKRHVYTVEENNTWKIPKAWKHCRIYVYGDEDTQFSLVEHPFENKT